MVPLQVESAAAELRVPSISPAAEARDVARAIAEARPAEPPRHLAAAARKACADWSAAAKDRAGGQGTS